MSVTKSEARALGSLYYSVRARAAEPPEVWQAAVAVFFRAYVIAAHTTHSGMAEVIGFVTDDEHLELVPLWEKTYRAGRALNRTEAIDALARGLKAAVYDELPEPGQVYGPDPLIGLSRYDVESWAVREIVDGLRQEGDVCFHYAADAVIRGLHLVSKHPNSKAAIMHWSGRGLSRASFEDCVFEGLNWGGRSYRAQHERFERCTFRNVDREHGDYENTAGDPDDVETPAIEYVDCLFEELSGQAVQTTGAVGKRRAETPDPDFDNQPGGPLVLRRSLLRNVSLNRGNEVGGGTSYPISHAYGKHDVLLEDVVLDNGEVAEMHGALLVQGQDLDDFERACTWLGGRIIGRNTNRPVASLQAMPRTRIEGVEFDVDGGQNKLQFDKGTGEVVIEGCKGSTRIEIEGQDVGSVADGVHYP